MNVRLASDSEHLAGLLISTKIGDLLTFDKMASHLGFPVNGGSSVVQRALDIAFRDARVQFSNERGVGYRRLDDEGVVASGARYAEGIRRKAETGISRLSCVDYVALTGASQIEHSARLAQLAATMATVSTETMAKLKSNVETYGRTLQVDQVFAAASGETSRGRHE